MPPNKKNTLNTISQTCTPRRLMNLQTTQSLLSTLFYSTQNRVKIVCIVVAHAALVHVLDIFLIVGEVVRIQPVFEVRPEPLNDSDILNPRLLRRVTLLCGSR